MTKFLQYFCLIILVFSLGCSAADSRMGVEDFTSVTDESFLSYRRGEQAYNFGDYEAAKRNFEEFTAKFPNEALHKVALFYLGRSYEQLQETEKAKESYREVITKYKGDFWADSAERRLRNLN